MGEYTAAAAVAAVLVAVPFSVALAFPTERAWVGVAGAAVALVAARTTGLVTGADVKALKRALRARP